MNIYADASLYMISSSLFRLYTNTAPALDVIAPIEPQDPQPTVDFFELELHPDALIHLAGNWLSNGRVATLRLHHVPDADRHFIKICEYPFNVFIECTQQQKYAIVRSLINMNRTIIMSENARLLSRDTVNFTGREIVGALHHVGIDRVYVAGCNHKWPLHFFMQSFGQVIDQYTFPDSNNNFYDIRLTYKSEHIVLLSASEVENPAGISDEDPHGIPHPNIEIFPMLASLGLVDGVQYGSLEIYPPELTVVRKVIAYSTVVNWAKAFFSGRADMTYHPSRYKVL